MADQPTGEDEKQHHVWEGDVRLLQGPPTEDEHRKEVERSEKEAQAAHRRRDLQLATEANELAEKANRLTEKANRLTGRYIFLTLTLALISALGTGAAWVAAKTARDTLNEMRTGQGAQDTHQLAEAAQTQADASLVSAIAAQAQADASTISSRAAQSAANTAKATLEAQSSPWIGIENEKPDFIPPTHFETDGRIVLKFTIQLHNYGAAPAREVSIYVPENAINGRYVKSEFFLHSNVCTESDQAERDVKARNYYGVESIVWPYDHRDFTVTIKTTKSPALYLPGCISYRGRSGSFQHTWFIYAISVDTNPVDQTPTIPKIRDVSLMGIEPLEQQR